MTVIRNQSTKLNRIGEQHIGKTLKKMNLKWTSNCLIKK
jgi:hypothetical protein